MLIGVINGDAAIRGDICPPLRAGGGGFWYIKRRRDGAVLMRTAWDYAEFSTETEARRYAARYVVGGVVVRWMPKLKTH